MNKQIVLFTGSQSLTGGTERAAADVARLLSDKGESVTILSLYDGKSSRYSPGDNVKLDELYRKRPRGLVKSIFAVMRLFRYVLKEQPRILISVESISFIYLLPLLLLNKRPYIINWEHFNAGVTLGSRLRALARTLSVRLADKIIVISDQDKDFWLRRFKCPDEKILRIYNVNPFDRIFYTGLSDEAKREKVVVAVGRLTAQKGFDLLIEAWSEISTKARKGWILRICGEGPDRLKLLAMIEALNLQDQVILVGHVPNMQLEYYKAQLFVLSSRFEGFGLVILEALTCGLPVVSFSCPTGPSEIIEDGVDGILVPPENVPELAQAIQNLLIDHQARDTMSLRAARSREKFSVESIGNQWHTLVRNIVRS